MCPTVAQCLSAAFASLSSKSDSANIDAQVLLAHVLEKDRAFLFTWPEKKLEPSQAKRWTECLARRVAGEPIAHIIGEKEFWSLSLYTDSSTLIPRPDTEILVEKALSLIRRTSAKILDLGTGTGAIALALAKERPDCRIDAVDCSEEALALANRNRVRHQVQNVNIFFSDWFSHIRERYDIILSNPPYIDQYDPHLEKGDLKFEPKTALVANDNGLADLDHIVGSSSDYLEKNGFVLVEHGWQQRSAVQRIFLEKGFCGVETFKDLAGNDRVTLGHL